MVISAFYANILQAVKETELPLTDVLSKLNSAGVSALDFDYSSISNGFPSELEQIGLGVNSLYAFVDLTQTEGIETAKKAIELGAEKKSVVMFVPRKLGNDIKELKSLTSEKEIFAWLDNCETAIATANALEKLSVTGLQKGVSVCIENFDSCYSMTERVSEIAWLFSKAPHLCYNADTGNAVTCGEDIAVNVERFREKIVNVHCKDRALIDGKWLCVAAGAGQMPIRAVQSDLLDNGYHGGFSVEVFGTDNALRAMLDSAAYLRSIS